MTDGSLIFDEGDLNGFVDGRLEASRAAALSDSLATDRDARARIDGWKRQNDSLRTMFASVLFEPVPLRLLPHSMAVSKPGAVSRASVTEPRPEPRAASKPDRPSGLVAMTMLGVALVAFVAGALTSLGTDDFGLSPRPRTAAQVEEVQASQEDQDFAARAAAAHDTFLTELTKPVEMTAADEPRLTRTIQHGLAGALRIPSLQHQGWALIGGRVVPGRHGPAAFLVYGNTTDKIGLYIARTRGLRDGGLRVVEGDGIDSANVAAWTDGTFGYALTTGRSADWLDRNAEALQHAIDAQLHEAGASP